MGFMLFIMAWCCLPVCLCASCCCMAFGAFGIFGFSSSSSAGRFLWVNSIGSINCGFSTAFSASFRFGDGILPGDVGAGEVDSVLLVVGSTAALSDALS